MSTDNPDTNSRPSESPSSPMTLRQQLLTIMTEDFNETSWEKTVDKLEALCQEIAREAYDRGYNTGWVKANRNNDGKRFTTTANELREIADRFDGYASELTSPKGTAAGNDLPPYDPEADIEATLRRKGQLTQKPEGGK